jgi:hypothetical protein
MRIWFLAAGLLASGAFVVLAGRMRRRHSNEIDRVSKEWLAEAASREDHVW